MINIELPSRISAEMPMSIIESIMIEGATITGDTAGRVMLSFTIGTDGKVSDVKVLRGVHEKLDAEALRIISMSPDWTPGQHEGKNVPVSFTIPIVFKIN